MTSASAGTVLMPGDIIGQASPARPLNAFIGTGAILSRCINELYLTTLAAGTRELSQTSTATIIVLPNRFQRLLFDLGLKAATTSATTVTIKVAFQLVDYDEGTDYENLRSTEKSVFSQVTTILLTNQDAFRNTYEFPVPNPGIYNVFVEFTNSQPLAGETTNTKTFVQVFHEVWS